MRIIAHLDMDAFFASVEERERPYLKGQPIAVGADPQGGKGRGVISTANYPARAYGIKSATPIRKAWELSEAARKKGLPSVVFISSGFRKYSETSKRIMAIVAGHLQKCSSVTPSQSLLPFATPSAYGISPLAPTTPPRRLGPSYGSCTPFASENGRSRSCDASESRVSPPQAGGGGERDIALEQVSVDECYFDLSFAGSFGKAKKIAEKIKKNILAKEKLSSSIGIGPNKLIAKIASDFQKPNGLTVILPEEALKFLESLPVRKIPGVGPKAEEKLARLRVRTIADGRKLSEERLKGILGKWGSELYRKLRGEDNSPVVVEAPPAKSIGEQETLPEDSLSLKVLLPYVERQAKNLIGYMAKEGFTAFQRIVLTVRFADFETVSRSRTLQEPTGSAETLRRHVTQMFFPFLDRQENLQKKKIRLVGIRIERLG